MSYKVKVTPHGQGSFYQGGFSSEESAKKWAKSYKAKGPYTSVELEIMKESKVNNMKVIVESKKFDKILRGKLKKMMESLVQLPNGEQKRMSPEEIEQLHYDEVPYEIVQDDIETEVDKETWGDEPEQVEEPVDNSDMISVDDEVEEDDEPQDIVDFLTKKTEPEEVKPNEPAVLSEFDDLSNEEKKALLLKLAKNDNDLNAILGAYLNKKVEEDAAGSEEVVDELNEDDHLNVLISKWRKEQNEANRLKKMGMMKSAAPYQNRADKLEIEIEKYKKANGIRE